MKRLTIAVLALLLTGCDPEEKYPAQVGLVNDFAEVLTPEEETKIATMLEGVKEQNAFVLVVVTVPDLKGDTIEDYTIGLANKWGVGQKGKDNGVVLLVAPKDRKLRIENGYGAEATLTDIESSRIMDNIIIPRLKSDKVSEGIVFGAQALAAKLGGGEIPAELEMEPVSDGLSPMTILAIAVVVLIMMCFPGGRAILFWVVIAIINSKGGRSGSGGSSSSGSSGGAFGGGGASRDY